MPVGYWQLPVFVTLHTRPLALHNAPILPPNEDEGTIQWQPSGLPFNTEAVPVELSASSWLLTNGTRTAHA